MTNFELFYELHLSDQISYATSQDIGLSQKKKQLKETI